MTGFAPNHAIVIFTDYVDNGLTGFLKTLVPVYTQLWLLTDVCGYACSDQFETFQQGGKSLILG